MVAMRWAAPEVIEEGIASTKSDVWSFGVLLWEIFSTGKAPYEEYTSANALCNAILSGVHLSRPLGTPLVVYDLMKWCWHKVEDTPALLPPVARLCFWIHTVPMMILGFIVFL